MKKRLLAAMVGLAMAFCAMGGPAMAGKKIVIAHRGASGYLPEHSLEAKAMAYAMGADYLEQDLVMTLDNQVVVLHDHYLDRVTNVATVYPDRKRADGRYYAIDFTLAEIKQLQMTEGFRIKDGKPVAGFSQRFPLWKGAFQVNTFEEEIEMIQGLNHTTGKSVGIYPEIKSPSFHRHEGKDISKAVLSILKKYGYVTKNDAVYLQCFDPIETERIAYELFPQFDMKVKLVQLIAETSWNVTMVYDGDKTTPYNFDWMFKKGAMERIAKYANGIGPWKPFLVKDGSTRNNLIITDMVKNAHTNGMEVHPYTFRLDNGRIPPYAASFEDMLDIYYYTVDVDGLFTDFPDRAVNFLRRAEYQRQGL